MAIINATSAGVERSFSCLKRLKSYTHNTMGQWVFFGFFLCICVCRRVDVHLWLRILSGGTAGLNVLKTTQTKHKHTEEGGWVMFLVHGYHQAAHAFHPVGHSTLTSHYHHHQQLAKGRQTFGDTNAHRWMRAVAQTERTSLKEKSIAVPTSLVPDPQRHTSSNVSEWFVTPVTMSTVSNSTASWRSETRVFYYDYIYWYHPKATSLTGGFRLPR